MLSFTCMLDDGCDTADYPLLDIYFYTKEILPYWPVDFSIEVRWCWFGEL